MGSWGQLDNKGVIHGESNRGSLYSGVLMVLKQACVTDPTGIKIRLKTDKCKAR